MVGAGTTPPSGRSPMLHRPAQLPADSMTAQKDEQVVTLDVGGQVYRTNRKTAESIYVVDCAMSCDPEAASFFFDRDGSTFGYLLDFHRPGGKLPAGLDAPKLSILKKEARFFGCQDLETEITTLYALRERVRQHKKGGGRRAAAAYRELALALLQNHSAAYAQRKLTRAQALDPNDALDVCFHQAWTDKVPTDPAAWRALGASLSAVGKWGAAACALQQAQQLRGEPEDHLVYAQALLKADRWAQAATALRTLLSRLGERHDPDEGWHTACYWGLSEALLRQSRHLEAIEVYTDAIARRPDIAHYHADRGGLQLDIEQGVLDYREALRLDPQQHSWYAALAELEQLRGELELANTAYQGAIALQPDCADYRAQLGAVLHAQGKHAASEQAYRQALRCAPHSGSHLADIGVSLLWQGKHAEAAGFLRRAVQADPKVMRYHHALSMAYSGQQKYPQAEQAGRVAVQLAPEEAAVHIHLGKLYFAQGLYAEAEKAYTQITRLEPDSAVHHKQLGLARLHQRKYESSEQALARAIELDPSKAIHYALLGDLYVEVMAFDKAEVAYQRALKLDAHMPLRGGLGRALAAQRKWEQAEQANKRDTELEPTCAAAFAALGHSCAAQMKYVEAEQAYREAVRLDPDQLHPSYRSHLCDAHVRRVVSQRHNSAVPVLPKPAKRRNLRPMHLRFWH